MAGWVGLAAKRFRVRGAIAWWVIAGLVTLAAGGAVGYKVLFDRPGEMATAYIPAEAQLVITVDLNPSPKQAQTFDTIRRSLEQEGLLDMLDKALSAAAAKNEIAAELRPHIHRSLAVAAWGIRPGKQPENGALLLSIDNPGAVSGILDKHLRGYAVDGVRSWVIDKNSTASIIDNYLIVAPNEASVRRLIAVRQGKERAVAALPEYQEARQALPSDANAMLFISSSALREGGKEAEQLTGANPFDNAGWFAMGLTVREQGLLCSLRSPFNADKIPQLAPLVKLPPLSGTGLTLIPSGAYGLLALSQPSALFQTVKGFAMAKEQSRREMETGLEKLRTESGFDLERDVLPAFQGEATAALYPGEGKDPDLLFVLTGENGATPAEFAEKFRAAVASGRFDKGKPTPRIVTEEYKGSTIYWLDLSNDPSAKGKTPGYVVLNGNVVAGTSVALLKRSVDVTGGGGSLSADLRYQKMLAHRIDHAKVAVIVDLPAILTEASKKGQGPQWDWNKVFGDDGVAFSATYDGRRAVGELFFPINWPEAIHRIGEEAKKSHAFDRPAGTMG